MDPATVMIQTIGAGRPRARPVGTANQISMNPTPKTASKGTVLLFSFGGDANKTVPAWARHCPPSDAPVREARALADNNGAHVGTRSGVGTRFDAPPDGRQGHVAREKLSCSRACARMGDPCM